MDAVLRSPAAELAVAAERVGGFFGAGDLDANDADADARTGTGAGTGTSTAAGRCGRDGTGSNATAGLFGTTGVHRASTVGVDAALGRGVTGGVAADTPASLLLAAL